MESKKPKITNEMLESVFNDIKMLGLNIGNLASIVQNPMECGNVTKENFEEWFALADKHKEKLSNVIGQVRLIYGEFNDRSL